MRGRVGLVSFVEEKFETVIDERKVEEETVSSQAVTAMTDDFHAAFGVVTV